MAEAGVVKFCAQVVSSVTNSMTYHHQIGHAYGHVTHFLFLVPLKYSGTAKARNFITLAINK